MPNKWVLYNGEEDDDDNDDDDDDDDHDGDGDDNDDDDNDDVALISKMDGWKLYNDGLSQ